MRKAILNPDNKLIDIRSEYTGTQKNIDITEEQVNEFLTHLNNDCFVFYDDATQSFTFKKNIFKIKKELREKRDHDLDKCDIWTKANVWPTLTAEQQQQVNEYEQELRDYIDKLNTIEDVENVPYPTPPVIDIGITVL